MYILYFDQNLQKKKKLKKDGYVIEEVLPFRKNWKLGGQFRAKGGISIR